MSAYLSRAVQFVGPLHRSQRAVLEALARMANRDGQCWPSHDRLASAAGLAASTVARCLKGLEEGALISREARTLVDGTRRPAIITVFPYGTPGPALPHSAILAALGEGEGGRNG